MIRIKSMVYVGKEDLIMFKIPKMNEWTILGLVCAGVGALATFVGKRQDENEEREKEANENEQT